MNERNTNILSIVIIAGVLLLVFASIGKAMVMVKPIEEYEPIYILEDGTPIYCCQIPIEHFFYTMIAVGVVVSIVGIAHIIDKIKEKKKND